VTEIREVLRAWQVGAGLPRVAEAEHADLTLTQRVADDHFAHAPGRICKKCDRLIAAGQPARRRGESGWVHDACQVTDD
jgi:hypothetical protein